MANIDTADTRLSHDVDWDSPDWGRPGHNVHVAHNGSWVPQCEKEE